MSLAYVDFSWSQYCIAVLAERLQYRVLHAAGCDLDCCDLISVKRLESRPSQKQSIAALCRCLGPQCCDRRFDGRIAWKVACGGTRDHPRYSVGAAREIPQQNVRDILELDLPAGTAKYIRT